MSAAATRSHCMMLDSGHRATLLEGEELAQQQKDFPGYGYKNGLVRLNPGGWLFYKHFSKFASGLYNFKVVYVVRNPKDMLLSYCHYLRLIFEYDFVGTIEDFYKYFIKGDLPYGSYDLHLKEAWERRNHPNLLFLFYEDMQADIMKELHRLNDFMGTKLTEEQLKKVAEYTSFESMKARSESKVKRHYNQDVWKKDGGFFRKGNSGDWKKSLTPELAAEMDSWTAKHLNFGITFK